VHERRLRPGCAELIAAVLVASACSAGENVRREEKMIIPPGFHRTHDSDEWVRLTFKLQKRYARVLLVDASRKPPARAKVAPLDLNARAPAEPVEHSVDLVFKTLQEASDAARGGDLVAVSPGTYRGFRFAHKADAGDGRYVHFRALGEPGDVVIDRPSESVPRHGWNRGSPRGKIILMDGAHHAIVQGFRIDGGNRPGTKPHGTVAGIKIEGSFSHTGKMAHHIAIVGNLSHHNRTWGMLTTDSHTVLVQGNLFGFSRREHSCYISDGSDNYVVRRNVFIGSNASGLQCNLDTVSCFRKLRRHAAMRGYPDHEPSREWALGLIKLATQKYGPNSFPDGKGINFIIEENVINGNGKAGGGSLNLAGVQDSLIQNNLLYGNFNHGIAQWQPLRPREVRAGAVRARGGEGAGRSAALGLPRQPHPQQHRPHGQPEARRHAVPQRQLGLTDAQ